MAARKKAAKKAARKKTTKKAAKRSTSKKTTKKATKKAGAKKAVAADGRAPRKVASAKPAKPAAPKKTAAELLADKLVKLTTSTPDDIVFEDLYAADCISREPVGEPAEGLAGLREKMAFWNELTKGSRFKARNVFVSGNTICIEWDAEIDMRDGRTIALEEIAIHELRDGKIAAERYYYDPSVLSPPVQEATGPVPDVPAPPRPPKPVESPGDPRIDPIDL